MEFDRAVLTSKTDRMVEIKREIERLKQEQSELEAVFLKCAEIDLQDTKLKTVCYASEHGRVTATMAASLKLVYPSYLKRIFGSAYSDAVTEETKCKLSAPASRMLTGLWMGDYSKMSLAQVIEQLPCDGKAKQVLAKKLKGAKYETDKNNLITVGGFAEKDAEQYAYFVFDAVIWENFTRLMNVNGIQDEASFQEVLNLIDGAVVVEETPKITVESN